MKKIRILLAAACVLTLLFAALPAACADIYPAPEAVQAGSELNHLVATVDPGTFVTYTDGSLPYGVTVVAENGLSGLDVYLRGTPFNAGSYDCIINLGSDGSAICHLDVTPAYPILLSTSSDITCHLNEPVQLEVSAYTPDVGVLSYQWYYGQLGFGTPIEGNSPTLSVGTATPGTSYYYCVVTNTNNGSSVQTTSAEIAVTVESGADSISGVSIYSLPFKTDYAVGEMLDTTGLQLLVSYSDGSSQLLAGGFTVIPTQLLTAGAQPIQVDYNGFSCFFNVNVQDPQETITGIGVLTLPYKTRYTIGETLDTTGLSIRAWMGNQYRDIDSGLVCSPTVLNVAGTQDILVSYENFNCTFTVTVEEPEHPVSLVVDTMPAKVTYSKGQSLDITGLVLKQISSRQNTQLIYSGFTCTPIQLTTVGRQVITVYFGDLSTSFTVTVTDVIPTPTPTPAQTPLPTTVPTAVPSSMPTPVPSAAAGVTPSPSPTVRPSSTRTSTHSSHQSNLGRTLIGVIVITALVALAVLGTYVFVVNQGGFEGAERKLRELFGRNRGGKHGK